MSRRMRIGIIAAGVLMLALGITFFYMHSRKEDIAPAQMASTSSPALVPEQADVSAMSIYTSGEYGFSFFYPSTAELTDAYATSTQTVPWRIGSLSIGTPIVRVISADGEVRVGRSADAGEASACQKAGPSETAAGLHTIGDTAWHAYTSEKLGTDNELTVTSYRTLRNDTCYALEVLLPLHGRADASALPLTVEQIAETFTFAAE